MPDSILGTGTKWEGRQVNVQSEDSDINAVSKKYMSGARDQTRRKERLP